MSLWDEIANDAPEILSELGREVEFRGQKILALIDNNPVDETMADGGWVYKAGYRVRFFVAKDSPLRKDPPKQGEQMMVYGRKFTVSRCTPRFPSPWFDTFVVSATQ